MCPFSSNLVHLPSSNFDSKDLQAAPSRRCRFEFSNVDLCACFSCFPQEVIRCLLLLGLLEVEHPVCFYSFVQGIVDNYRAAEEQFVDLVRQCTVELLHKKLGGRGGQSSQENAGDDLIHWGLMR